MAAIVDPYGSGLSKREFVITELTATSSGYVDSAVKFAWDAQTQSSPRGAWEIAIKLRTVREDYPGTDIPTEQVLGFNYEPFTLTGFWDDRYAGAQFAEKTRAAFEDMVIRGNLCRFEFERVSIHGIITEFKPSYHQSFRVGYSFTVSPHFKNKGGDLRTARKRTNGAPEATANPNRYVLRMQAIVTSMAESMALAPREAITGDTYDSVAGMVGDVIDTLDRVNTIIDSQVLAVSGAPQNTLASVVNGFESIQSTATDLIAGLAALRTDNDLSHESALGNLAFESWRRNLAADSRAVLLEAFTARSELGKRVAPDAKALYRPRAGESLYAVSNRFYNTPHKWRLIATRNNLHTFTLTGTEMLVIPQA
jgi:hypothetical protein